MYKNHCYRIEIVARAVCSTWGQNKVRAGIIGRELHAT